VEESEMKRTLLLLAIMGSWIPGCGPAMSTNVKEQGALEPIKDGQNGAGSALEMEGAYKGPAQHFTARSHPPHTHTGYVEPPDLNSLPKLEIHLSECYYEFQREAEIAAAQSARGTSSRAKSTERRKLKQRSAGVAMGAGQGGAVPQSAAPRSAPPPESSKAELSADVVSEQLAAESEPGQIARDEDSAPQEEVLSEYENWGAKIYLSNDDTMSLSSAQRVIYAIDHFLPLPAEHIRPHELLNYFSFETARVSSNNDFSILADIAAEPREAGIYTLSLAIRGRPVDRTSRRNAAISLVIDRSGSMRAEGRMEYLKRGLMRMVDELKKGDMVHMVLFDHQVCTPVENFVVGRDDPGVLLKAINALRPQGSTDLHSGLSRGYEIADRSYRPGYSNRVILITDALTNTGVTDQQMISMISKYYESRQIRLSGVGVGRNFNDALLDRLTERGKGAYVFLGSEAEVDAVFGSRFISLVETTALDVHFRLHLPKSLRMNVFYGEESSTVKEDVQAIHYFANTSQLFLSDLVARGGRLRPQDDVMLTIEYQDAESGDPRFEEYAFNLGEIQNESAFNVLKGRLIMAWIDMLALMASRPVPSVYGGTQGTWEDEEGYGLCYEGGQELHRLAKGLEETPEVRRVLSLWDKYCARYERPRRPVRRSPVPEQDTWPSAQ